MIHSNVPIWKQAPFIRLCPPFIVGILMENYIQLPFLPLAIPLLLASLVMLSTRLLSNALLFKSQLWVGLVTQFIIMILGALVCFRNMPGPIDHDLIGHSYPKTTVLVVRLNEPLIENQTSYKARATLMNSANNEHMQKIVGQVILYIQKDSISKKLQYGQVVAICKPLSTIKNTGNPGTFDYATWCRRQGILYQVFLKANDWNLLNKTNPNCLYSWLFQTQTRLLNILRRNITGEKEKGIAEALMLGYRGDLEESLFQAYSNTGVIHIIAISGLHLGLLYALLAGIFNYIDPGRRFRWIKFIATVSFLWLFSLLTGAGASVLRSAVMFSCISLGETLSMKTSIYNSLFASAFLLLTFNPYFLWDVGFQLSYAAVFGIVLFFTPLYKSILIPNQLLNQLWKLCSTTLCAQVFTLPICLYYFHQFSNLFIFSNLVAIPLSSIILLGELALCLISPLPAIASFFGKYLSAGLWFMNTYIETINDHPWSVITGLQISLAEMFIMLGVGCLMAIGIGRYRKPLFWAILYLMILNNWIKDIYLWQSYHQRKMIVYNIPHNQAIDFIAGTRSTLVTNDLIAHNQSVQNSYFSPCHTVFRVKSLNTITHIPAIAIFAFSNKRIGIVATSINAQTTPVTPIDILILSNNDHINIETLYQIFHPAILVFDATCSKSHIQKWKNDCDRLTLRYHSIPEEGAFILE